MANEPEADPERDQRTVFAYQVKDVNLFHLNLNFTAPHPLLFAVAELLGFIQVDHGSLFSGQSVTELFPAVSTVIWMVAMSTSICRLVCLTHLSL